MTKNQKRDIATSITTLVFLVVGTTGVFMYFHILNKYIKEMHEILGLVFVAAVAFHVFVNFSSMKQYFKKKTFYALSIITVLVAVMFVFNAPDKGSNKKLIVNSVLNANIQNSFLLFVDDMEIAKVKLEVAGIKIDKAKTIKEISKENNTSPDKIIDILKL